MSVVPEQLIAGPNEETLGIRALLDGKDGPRALFVQGPMPSAQASRTERHTSWMEFNGISSRGRRLIQWPGPVGGDETGAAAMAASRGGQFVAACFASPPDKAKCVVEVKRLDWACNNVNQAEKLKWKGSKPTPPIPKFDGRVATPAQLWLSDDGCTVAVMVVDPADPSHRELYVIGRAAATSEWAGLHWLKPGLPSPHTADGLNLSAQDMNLGIVQVVLTHTPAMGRCCHISHAWRTIAEGDPYRGEPSQLVLHVRALCLKLDDGEFKKGRAGKLPLLHRALSTTPVRRAPGAARVAVTGADSVFCPVWRVHSVCWVTAGSWTSSVHQFGLGDKDAVHPPLVAQLDPRGAILVVVVNQAAHQPLLFIGMPGFDQTRGRSSAEASGGAETPLTLVDLQSFRDGDSASPVQDLAWSIDGGLLAVVTADSHMCILPRLGMPLPLHASPASSAMQKVLVEFVRPPPREPDAASVSMPALKKRVSLQMCPINTIYPYFALPGVAPTVSELGGVAGDGSGGVSSQGSQTAESLASNAGGGATGQQKVKLRLLTICAHGQKATEFAVCDGAVTVILSAKSLDTRDDSKTPEAKQILEQVPFSAAALVAHLSMITRSTPTMSRWPSDPLASFARAAQIALAMGRDLEPTAIKGSLGGREGVLRQFVFLVVRHSL